MEPSILQRHFPTFVAWYCGLLRSIRAIVRVISTMIQPCLRSTTRLMRPVVRQPRITAATVAVVLVIGSENERRREMFQHRAAELRWLVSSSRANLRYAVSAARATQDAKCSIIPDVDPEDSGLPASVERLRRQALYYQRLKDKYERAARYPWLPIAPDPPRTDGPM
jgi:hypothetical protein